MLFSEKLQVSQSFLSLWWDSHKILSESNFTIGLLEIQVYMNTKEYRTQARNACVLTHHMENVASE